MPTILNIAYAAKKVLDCPIIKVMDCGLIANKTANVSSKKSFGITNVVAIATESPLY